MLAALPLQHLGLVQNSWQRCNAEYASHIAFALLLKGVCQGGPGTAPCLERSLLCSWRCIDTAPAVQDKK
jgi:hypothetical protein